MSLILSGTNGLSDVDGSAATPAIRGTDANTGIFFPAADTIAFAEGGVEAMRLDSSGNLGLGVTPSAWGGSYKAFQFASGAIAGFSTTALDIYGNAYDSGAGAWKYLNSSQGATRYAAFNGQHQWFTALSGTAGNAISFTQAMTLTAAGRLGIGTTSPTKNLEVLNSGDVNVGIRSTGSSNFVSLRLQDSSDGAGAVGSALHHMNSGYVTDGAYFPDGCTLTSFGSGGLNFLSNSEQIRFYGGTGSGSLRLTLNNSYLDGNTLEYRAYRYTNPAGPLGTGASNARNHFTQFNAGNASLTTGWIAAAFGDTNAPRIVIGQGTVGGSARAIIGAHNADLTAWGDIDIGGSVIRFSTNGSQETARIDSSGSVFFGKTAFNLSQNGAAFLLGDTTFTISSGNTLHVYDGPNGVYRFYVSSAGQIHATSTSISGISDRTLKENIRDLETGLSEVMALKPRRFDWKNGDAQNVAGFVAQEVEEVLPELVADYVYNKSEDGNDIIKKSLKMGDILPTLVNAMQEQQALIAQLQADVATLKGAA